MAASEKESLRALAIRGGPFTDSEQAALLDYCQTDVDALVQLLPAMLPELDLPRALLRGRYMAAAARMEWVGTPIDTETLVQLHRSWHYIRGQLITAINKDYSVYVPLGQKPIDPSTKLGTAILEESKG